MKIMASGRWSMGYNVGRQAIPIDSVNVSTAVITLNMVRNPMFYYIYLVIPSVLMAFVSVLVFLLPPESGERVGLSITVLLSYTVVLLMASEVTPRGGANIPHLSEIDCYLTEVISSLL